MSDDQNALYEAVEPYESLRLPVGDGHELHVDLSGNPDGIPVVFLHGGRVLEHAPAAAFFAGPASPEATAFLRGDLLPH